MPYHYAPYVPPGDFAGDVAAPFVFVLIIAVAVLLMGGLVYLIMCGCDWVVKWYRGELPSQRARRRLQERPNPWENEQQWNPVTPPPPVRSPRKQPPRYVQQEQQFEARLAQGPRSPVRLLHSVAFERMTDGALEEIRCKAPGCLERLREAVWLLAQSQTAEAENILFQLRGRIRRGFGEGNHWLEAIIIADIAALCHHSNRLEDADHYFERAAAIAAKWTEKYPWLNRLATKRRLIHNHR